MFMLCVCTVNGEDRGQHGDGIVDNTYLLCVCMVIGDGRGQHCDGRGVWAIMSECVIGMAEGRIIRFQSCVLG